jgi:hypothetical protein
METHWGAKNLPSDTCFLRLQQGDGTRDIKRVQLVQMEYNRRIRRIDTPPIEDTGQQTDVQAGTPAPPLWGSDSRLQTASMEKNHTNCENLLDIRDFSP